MNKTKIEWADYTVNPVKGKCQNACWYCYARRMYDRFKWDPEVRFDDKEMDKVAKIKKPSRIFVGSTHELFGNWIPSWWIRDILISVKRYPQHTFIFLTKNPKRYVGFEFPENCWLGVTITGKENNQSWVYGYTSGMGNKRFISFEPLLESPMPLVGGWHEWVIIGALTGPGSKKHQPKKEWVEDIMRQAGRLNIPLFLKDNLMPIMGEEYVKQRQEWPKEKRGDE